MKCRKLYKIENKDNYNIMFFRSKGTKLPQNIKCSISEDNGTDLIEYGIEEIFPEHSSSEIGCTITFVKPDRSITLQLIFDLIFDYVNLSECRIENMRIRSTDSFSAQNKTFYISFFSEKTITKIVNGEEVEETKKLPIYQKDFTLSKTDDVYTYSFQDIIEYKNFCLAIKEDTDSNYADKQEGVSYSLIQRLSILKGELWYRINYGLPLLDKVRSGAILDSVIINIILSHPDVTNITKFQSSIIYDFY